MQEPYSEKDLEIGYYDYCDGFEYPSLYDDFEDYEEEGRVYLQLAVENQKGAIGFAQKLVTGIFLLSLHAARIALKVVGENIEIVVEDVEIE